MRRAFSRALLAMLAGGGLLACGSEEPARSAGPQECVPTDKYFAQEVWTPILSQRCIACHNAQGAAKDSNMVLQPASQTGYLEANLEIVRNEARLEIDGVSLLLLKPSAQVDHGGAQVIEKDGPEYRALAGLVDRFENPVDCGDGGDVEGFDGLLLLDPSQTLRKASLSLVGRLPTEDEQGRVEAGGEEALSKILDEQLTEEAFYERLKEAFNDLFLTDRYRGGERAIALLDAADFPWREWYEDSGQFPDPAEVERLRKLSNEAVAREPLELVARVVRDERPFSEILTADYRLVNPYSAKVYGMSVGFDDPSDPAEWKEGRLEDVELAGVLTSPMFLNRFPTTATNRNRHRARKVFEFFLATDLMKLAERPVDPTAISDFNPTMYNPGCTVCHAGMDPVAGAFQNWDERGRFRPPESGWHTDMRPPGYGDDVVPHDERLRSLPWLAQRIAEDPLFATSTVHIAYTMLTGQQPLSPPADPLAPGGDVQQAAFDRQHEAFQKIAADFVADGFNFKTAVKGVVLGPYFRALDAVDDEAGARLADLGTSRLLTPEALNRKVQATTGFPWRWDPPGRDYLTDVGNYAIFYGGIDSDGITRRIVEPSGIMASVAARMANEMACRVVPQELARPAEERRLLPLVERTFVPEDENGFEVPGAVEAIRENIALLHERLLGERLVPGDPELERTYALFLETWKEGKEAVAAGTYDANLHWICQARNDWWTGEEFAVGVATDREYTVRAWMAVMTYLLLDYRFLYE